MGRRSVYLREGLKEKIHVIFGDADAGIGDFKADGSLGFGFIIKCDAKTHLPALYELYRIAK